MSPPLFLLGCPRSGTSLLYKSICLHPDAAWISNYVRRVPAVPQLAALNRVHGRLPRLRSRAWFGSDGSNAYVYQRHRPVAERVFPMPVEGEPVFRRCGLPELPGGTTAPDAAARLRRAVRRICSAAGSGTFVSKRIANNQRIPILLEAFPDARFVCITRDGRGVAASLSKVDWWNDSIVFWYGGSPAQWAAEGRDPWELCAREWVEQVRSLDEGLGTVPASQVLHMRYEDLVADPLAVLARTIDFAGMRDDPDHRRRLGELSFPRQAGSWRRDLPPAALATIEAVQDQELRARGYEVRT